MINEDHTEESKLYIRSVFEKISPILISLVYSRSHI